MSRDTFSFSDEYEDRLSSFDTDSSKAKGDPVELKDGFPYRAGIKWHAGDIETLADERSLDWSLKECDDFLFGYENYLQERMCEFGWEALECYMDDFLSEQEDETV